MENKNYLDFILKVQSISKIGMLFSKDPYAIENYEELNVLSTNMLEDFTSLSFERANYFARDVYPTPNVSVRTIILNEKKEILMVQEVLTGLYSLPGGWCDIGDTPSLAAKKEVLQEAGYECEIVRLVGVINRNSHKGSNGTPEYVIVFEAKATDVKTNHHHETSDVAFFKLDSLPKISRKLSLEELERIINAVMENKTIFD